MRSALGMDGQDVGARLAIGLQPGVDRRDHQMHVERKFRVRPQGLHHIRADGDVRHEMAVHDVDMDPVRAGSVQRANFFAQHREVAGKDGRTDQGLGHEPGIRRVGGGGKRC